MSAHPAPPPDASELHVIRQRLETLAEEQRVLLNRVKFYEAVLSSPDLRESFADARERDMQPLRGSLRIIGDIVGPVCDPDEWEANR